MSTTRDIVIIGGGVMGTSIAYYLTQRGGATVTLLERQALGNGTTGRSGAIVRQHYSNDFTIRMARDSLHVFQHFAEIIGGDCGFFTTGLLVTVDEKDLAALQANVTLQQAQGVPTRMIAPAEIAHFAPGFSDEFVAGACYEENTGVADPMATTHAFATRARDLGAIIREGCEVTGFITSGTRLVGVRVGDEIINTATVIIAANVWSASLLRPLGITLPITATRHPMVALRRPDDAGGRTGMHAVCLDTIHGIYLRPDLGGITLVGTIANILTPSDPGNYAQGLSEAEITFLHTSSSTCLLSLKRAVPRGGWAGIYDDTPDFHPILDQLPGYENLYCASGFSGHGFKLSPVVGQWMSEFVLTGHKADDMHHLHFSRFASGQHILPHYASGVLG